MTVHGAKGLEAPIVILADTTTPPAGPASAAAAVAATRKAAPDAPRASSGLREQDNDDRRRGRGARDRARRRRENEYRRLLYVAMTRAADRLVVCGVDRREQARREGCWYELVAGALKRAVCCRPEPADDGDGEVRRYRKTVRMPRRAPQHPAARRRRPITMPGWLNARLTPTPVRAAPIKPSGFVDDPDATAAACAPREARRRAHPARQHRAPADAVAAGHSGRCAGRRGAPPYRTAEHGLHASPSAPRSCDRRWRLLGDPRFAPLFAPGSRAEVPIVGRIEWPHRDRRGRPAGGRTRHGPDRGLQDQPSGAAQPRGDAGALSGLCRAAGALPRRADAALSEPAGPRRFGVDGYPRPWWKFPPKRWMRRSQPSPPRDPP